MPPRGRRKKTQEPEPEPEPEVRDDQDDDAHDGGPPPANDTSASAGAGADGDPPPQSSDDEGASPAARPSRAPAPSAASAGGRGEDGVFKILICTDNHLGYAERDQIRGGDSFAAFEECFQLARHHGADFVLNSGDIFHENKPSRLTLHRTMEILRRYCMGDNAVGFQIMSDQRECLRSTVSGRANYEDEFYSVDMPLFGIHGNHDDPTRDGGSEMLSAMDLLSVANLLNYFGRQDEVDNVRISPVLLRKGSTKIALYGLGSMRDERLNRMWQAKKVKFLRPRGDGGGKDDDGWFNIFCIHQNRDAGRGSKNCVHESMIPEWMDLVFWGHEHECLIEPDESLVGTFRISQPGSSVATTLSQGEAKRKHCGLLEVRGNQFRMTKIPLGSVRSFAEGGISLKDVERNQGGVLDVEDPKIEEKMASYLADQVESLIERALEEGERLQEDARASYDAVTNLEEEFDGDKRKRRYEIRDPEKVLVRLRVEHTGFSTLNNQRFGAQFVGRVANPSDILLFHKKRSAESAKSGGASKKKSAALDMPEQDDIDDTNIEDLVKDNLMNSSDKKPMMVLDEKKMTEALHDYVDKDEKDALDGTVKALLLKTQKVMSKRQKGHDDEDDQIDDENKLKDMMEQRAEDKRAEFIEAMNAKTEKQDKKKTKKASTSKVDDSVVDSDDEEMEDSPPAKKKASRVATSKKTASKSAGRRKAQESDDDSMGFSEEEAPKKKRAAPARKKAATTKRKKKAADSDDDDDSVEFAGVSQPSTQRSSARARTSKKPKYTYDDDDVEEIDDDSDEETPKPKSRKKAAGRSVASSARTSRAKVNETQSTLTTSYTTSTRKSKENNGRKGRAQSIDSDSDDEPATANSSNWGTASQSTKGRGRR